MLIAICDDEEESRAKLHECLRQFEVDKGLDFDIVEYDKPENLLNDFLDKDAAKKSFDVIFLDIYMNDDIGTDTARKLRENAYEGSIVFCTTSKDHAIESYELRADGYLLKPFEYDDFKKAIWRLLPIFDNNKKTISFVSDRIEYNVPVSAIVAIETESKGSLVHMRDSSHFTWKKIGEFKKELSDDNSFYSIGRSFIVNLNHIKECDNDKLLLTDKSQIFFPVRDSKKIRQVINDFFWNQTRGNS